MDILFLLIPFSVVLVFIIIVVFAWAIRNDQFEDIEREGLRILQEPYENPSFASTSSPDVDQPTDRSVV